MPKIIAALVLFLAVTVQVTPAFAECTYHTYMYGSRIITCTTCCFGSSCNTTCT